jgi:cation diffusion facilitator CzcD-associated flavoprotein CzcO
MTAGPVVIIGAGHAGFQLAMSLRQHGFSDRIALMKAICRTSGRRYPRPI